MCNPVHSFWCRVSVASSTLYLISFDSMKDSVLICRLRIRSLPLILKVDDVKTNTYGSTVEAVISRLVFIDRDTAKSSLFCRFTGVTSITPPKDGTNRLLLPALWFDRLVAVIFVLSFAMLPEFSFDAVVILEFAIRTDF